MENNDEIADVVQENHCSSFFQSSCPSSGNFDHSLKGDLLRSGKKSDELRPRPSTTADRTKKSGGKGGFTCCVSLCFNNSKKHPNLSFYNFPNGKSKEKQLLRKQWIHMVARKDFKPTIGHRVSSEHFVGGQKHT